MLLPICSALFRARAALHVLLLSSALCAATLPARAEGEICLRGAELSRPAAPVSLDVDLRDLPPAPEWQPGDAIKEIPRRHTRPPQQDELERAVEPQDDPLLALQEAAQAPGPDAFTAPILNFNGQGYTGVNPADPTGDVGPNHYIQAINQSSGTRVTVYGKTGSVLSGPFTLATLGGTGACATGHGDPIVLHDGLANRWLLSEFAASGNHLCVYVSKTADPISGGWWFYDFSTPNFPDYPKYAVWPDAYYVGTNESSPAAYALDRARMLNGQSATSQRFTAARLSGFPFQMLTPADVDGATAPPAGMPGLFLRHKDSEAHGSPGAADTVEIFEFRVNWTTPASSTFTGPTSVSVSEFDSDLCGLSSFNCFPQPGSATTLDPLREVVMFRAQYRNRGTFQSLAGNFVTDVNGANRGGLRWFELRKSGTNPWSLQTEGTYSPDATNRWMGSAALDKAGDLAVAYSVSSTSVYPGLRYAGRLAGDAAGTLTQGEATLVNGSAANASNRWGDYAQLTVDPSDDCTFWFTGMYSPTSTWATRIASFKFDQCNPDFTVSCSPASLTLDRGRNGTSYCSVQPQSGYNSLTDLSCSGLPAGVTCSFNPPSVTPSGGPASSTLTVSVGASAPLGTRTFLVQGTGGGLTRTFTMTLTVNQPPDFDITCTPSTVSVEQGNTRTATCSIFCGPVPLAGAPQPDLPPGPTCRVTLSCSGLPSGASCAFSPNPTSVTEGYTGNSTLSLTVAGSVPVGSYAFQVQGTNGAFSRTSNALTLSVITPPAPDYSVSCNPAALTVDRAGSKTSACTVATQNWSGPPIALACAGLPAGASCTFSPNPVTPPAYGGSGSTLTLAVASSTVPGTYSFQVQATAAPYQRTFNMTLTVPSGDFSIACSPSSLSIWQGYSKTTTCTLTSLEGFSAAVSLSCTNLPTGVTCGFSPNPVTPPSGGSASSTVTVYVAETAPTGNYSFQVRGTSGTLVRSFSVVLKVLLGP